MSTASPIRSVLRQDELYIRTRVESGQLSASKILPGLYISWEIIHRSRCRLIIKQERRFSSRSQRTKHRLMLLLLLLYVGRYETLPPRDRVCPFFFPTCITNNIVQTEKETVAIFCINIQPGTDTVDHLRACAIQIPLKCERDKSGIMVRTRLSCEQIAPLPFE